MGRLVLGILIAVSLLWVPAFAPGPAHARAGGCSTVAMQAAVHAANGAVHPPQNGAPARDVAAMLPCCLAAWPGVSSGLPFLVMRSAAGRAEPGFADDILRGLFVEPAERPPRTSFLPSA